MKLRKVPRYCCGRGWGGRRWLNVMKNERGILSLRSEVLGGYMGIAHAPFRTQGCRSSLAHNNTVRVTIQTIRPFAVGCSDGTCAARQAWTKRRVFEFSRLLDETDDHRRSMIFNLRDIGRLPQCARTCGRTSLPLVLVGVSRTGGVLSPYWCGRTGGAKRLRGPLIGAHITQPVTDTQSHRVS